MAALFVGDFLLGLEVQQNDWLIILAIGIISRSSPDRMMLAPPMPKVRYHWWLAS